MKEPISIISLGWQRLADEDFSNFLAWEDPAGTPFYTPTSFYVPELLSFFFQKKKHILLVPGFPAKYLNI